MEFFNSNSHSRVRLWHSSTLSHKFEARTHLLCEQCRRQASLEFCHWTTLFTVPLLVCPPRHATLPSRDLLVRNAAHWSTPLLAGQRCRVFVYPHDSGAYYWSALLLSAIAFCLHRPLSELCPQLPTILATVVREVLFHGRRLSFHFLFLCALCVLR
ncbi:hypothetical protein Syun_029769 [Stephania yunnanensis]|uniref:Uncharacterized protein n=1 Tax=Stephania yunnanensis TaxID=152371 RepID=A0AAP0HLN8_9MAGN